MHASLRATRPSGTQITSCDLPRVDKVFCCPAKYAMQTVAGISSDRPIGYLNCCWSILILKKQIILWLLVLALIKIVGYLIVVDFYLDK
jgi:hypothetical protein